MSSRSRFMSPKEPSPTSPSLSQVSANRTGQNASVGLCDYCGIKPKFYENGRVHPYCGRRCAAEHKKDSQQVPSRNSQWQQSQSLFQSGWARKSVDCPLQDCKNPGRNQFGGYCSDEHSKAAMRKSLVKSCSQCGRMPASSGDLCISCQRYQGTTNLKELPNTDSNFKSVVQCFVDNWKPVAANIKTPRVMKVLEVNLSRKAQNSYEAYRKTLGKRPSPSEFWTFHSSQCVCDLGTQTQQQLCEHSTCGICSIVRSNFTDFGCGEKINIGNFGPGVYSYMNSFRADKYATSCTSSPYRAMILCTVLIEKASLNSQTFEDTVVVKDTNAIIPTHIILYL